MADPLGDFYTEYALALCLSVLTWIYMKLCSIFLHILFSIIQTPDSEHIREQ